MNRPGAVPQTLRGMPGGFGGQQQPQQPARSVSNRLPNGKLATNGSGWPFGAGVPLGGGGLQNPRGQLGGNVSFAQSLSGSQPATPLDLSEFPSLGNNAQLGNGGQASLWSSAGSRGLGGPLQRTQNAALSSQSPQPEDIFSNAPAARLAAASQASFRFGAQNNVAQPPQASTGASDDFPPLSRAGNGELGQDRSAALLSNLGFGAQGGAPGAPVPGNRANNGLLNALSANTRSAETRPPPGVGAPGSLRPQEARGAAAEEDERTATGIFGEEDMSMPSSAVDGAQQPTDAVRTSLGAIGIDATAGKGKAEKENRGSEPQDPLAGMPEVDKWGFKGLRTLMSNYPDRTALMTGLDPSTLGLDLQSTDLISTQIYSLFDDMPPRPAVPKYHLPDCYHVTNIQPIETKISNFNEETLFWIFYSCPQDARQQLAAQELHSRNWRWHKKLQVWLTKDDSYVPQQLSPQHERGYYLIWDTNTWQKARRQLEINYNDLDTSLSQAMAP